jgi:hypothetical protein
MPAHLDILTPIHKGLLSLLFDTSKMVGRLDFTSSSQAAIAGREVRRCTSFLREHANNEDGRVRPVLARLAPTLAATMSAEHQQLEQEAADVERLLPGLAAANDAERLQLGVELRHRFDLLLAHHVRHMTWEEEEVNAALWAGLSDEELGAIVHHVVADIGPARMREWDVLVLSATNRQEQDARSASLAEGTLAKHV